MHEHRACATIGAAVLWACCAMVPWAHAAGSKCDVPSEERVYELVEIQAEDGGSVPETVRARWTDGVTVRARLDGVSVLVLAIDEEVIMESTSEGQ